METLEESYVSWLARELAERKTRNPLYSLRAFARDLGVPASHLSETLRGRRGLSPAVAAEIALRLELSPIQAEHFTDLVAARHARSQRERSEASRRIEARRAAPFYHPLETERFMQLTDWVHFAIIELTKTADFVPDTAWIAQRLQVQRARVEEATLRLERLGLLERGAGAWRIRHTNTWSGREVPSLAIKRFHRSLLKHAEQALFQQGLEDREFASLVVAINADQIPIFKQRIREMLKELDEQAERSSTRHEVYCFSLQMFRAEGTE